MQYIKKITLISIHNNPIFIGVAAIVATLLFGAIIAFATGANIPTLAHAQVAPPCCTLPLPPPSSPPPPLSISPTLAPVPTCSISTSPSTLTYGGGSTIITWTTSAGTSASINNGIGNVSPVSRGSKSISVTTTTNYKMTVSGPGGQTTCSTKVTVKPPPPVWTNYCTGANDSHPWQIWAHDNSNPVNYKYIGTNPSCAPPSAPTCTLSASPTSIQNGSSSKLTYTTSNATSFSIDNGVGTQTSISNGSASVSPTNTTTYTGTAKGAGGTVTCGAKVTVTKTPPPTPSAPTCTLSASPTSIQNGSSSKLTYTTSNATSFTVNHSVGTLTPVSGGSKLVSPTNTTTYTGTAKGAGGTVTCGAKVTVTKTPPPTPSAPTCTLSASPTSMVSGASSKLTWTTSNATSFSIDNGIGKITNVASGATTTTPTNTVTYTGTANSENGTAVCKATVTVNHGGGGGGSMCVLIVSPSTMSSGATATLSWGGRGIKSIFISNGVGTTTSTSGSSSVSPSVGTHTYAGTFTTFGGQKLKCSSTLTVTGGGGTQPPIVTLTILHKPPVSHLLALVYLSQIPYTGLDLGTIGTIIYWLILVVWSVAVAYILLFIVIPFLKHKAQTFGTYMHVLLNTPSTQQNSSEQEKLSESSHIQSMKENINSSAAQKQYSSYNGFKSFSQSGTLSVKDIVQGLSHEKQNDADIATASQQIPQIPMPISGIISRQTMTHSKEKQQDPQSIITPTIDETKQAIKNEILPTDSAFARGFLASLLEGDRTAVFAALRQVSRGGGNVSVFLSDVTCILDDAYRARIDGTDCDENIVRLVAKYQTPVLEGLVSALATAIDSSYSSDITAAKLAITHALARIGA